MFDLIFDAAMAWNQIGLILVGTVFMAIGGGLIAYELYWRIKATKIKGRISAVRVSRSANRVRGGDNHEISESEPLDIAREFKKDPVAASVGGIFVLLFLGFPLFFSGMGIYMGYSYFHLTKTGEYAQATVIRNDSSYDSDSGTSYKAVLTFYDGSGRQWEVKDSISYGSSASYSTGTRLGVYYKMDDPKTFVIDDFWHNMAISILFFCFGFIFIGFFVAASLSKKKLNKRGKKNLSPGHRKSFAGEVFYSTFEYKAPNGERIEHVSEMGSNSLLNRIPGTPVTLMVFPDNLHKVRRPTVVLLIFGTIFFLPGVFIMNIAFTSFEANYIMFSMILAGVIFSAYKIRGVSKKISMGEFKKGWEELKKKGIQVTSSSGGGGGKGRVLEKSEILERLKVQCKHARIAGYIMTVIFMGLICGAYFTGLDMIDRVKNDVRVTGEVVDINSRYSNSSDSRGYTYYSVVKFVDTNGSSIRFEDNVGASHPMHKQGDDVSILYPPENPEDAIIDRGMFNWGLSGGLALGALLILFGALHNLRATRSFGRNKYFRRV